MRGGQGHGDDRSSFGTWRGRGHFGVHGGSRGRPFTTSNPAIDLDQEQLRIHASIDVLDFGLRGWTMPRVAADAGRRADQFHLCVTHDPAMSGTGARRAGSPILKTGYRLLCHGPGAPLASDGGEGEAGRHGISRGSPGLVALEVHGQAGAATHPRLRRPRDGGRQRSRLAHRWLRCWLLASVVWGGRSIERHGGISVKGLCAAHRQASAVRQDDPDRRRLPGFEEVHQSTTCQSGQVLRQTA